eukprot:RCo027022
MDDGVFLPFLCVVFLSHNEVIFGCIPLTHFPMLSYLSLFANLYSPPQKWCKWCKCSVKKYDAPTGTNVCCIGVCSLDYLETSRGPVPGVLASWCFVTVSHIK